MFPYKDIFFIDGKSISSEMIFLLNITPIKIKPQIASILNDRLREATKYFESELKSLEN